MENLKLSEKEPAGFPNGLGVKVRAVPWPPLCFLVSVLAIFCCSCASTSGDLYYKPFVKKSYSSCDEMRTTTLPDEVLKRQGYRQIGVMHVTLMYSRCVKKCETYTHDMNSINRLYKESRKRGAHLLKVLNNNTKKARNYTMRGKCIKHERKIVYKRRWLPGHKYETSVREEEIVCVKWEPVKASELSYYSRGVLWRKD